MKPPECAVCGLDGLGAGADQRRFVTRAFADYRPLPDGWAGHPDGLLWLCPECDRATADVRELVSSEAVGIARRRRGLDPRS